MIEVEGLTKRYGSTLAVDDLSFTVEPGAITGFLGPNGAGQVDDDARDPRADPADRRDDHGSRRAVPRSSTDPFDAGRRPARDVRRASGPLGTESPSRARRSLAAFRESRVDEVLELVDLTRRRSVAA